MIDLDALLQTASLPERTVLVCLDGALNSTLLAAKEALDATEGSDAPADGRLTQMPAAAKAKQEYETARDAVRAAAVPFVLRGLSRPDWTALVNDHPPREDKQQDRILGFNGETFQVALVRACLVDPKPSDAQWAKLDQILTFAQFDDLVAAAMEVSRSKEDIVPFSSVGSAPTLASAKK